MEEQIHHLHQPLIHSATTSGGSAKDDEFNPSNIGPGIIFQVALIISIGLIAIWANHESTKGFSITVINDADHDTLSARYFSVFYAANDKATRIVYTSSRFIEDFLYPNESYFKKQVNHVILRLSSRNLTESVVVESRRDGEFVVYISPSVMAERNHDQAMQLAVKKGMSRLWINDGFGGVPTNLMDGIVEYISTMDFSGGVSTANGEVGWPESLVMGACCWKSKKSDEVVQFLKYHEMKNAGFIRRLNQNLRSGWEDRMVDVALGSLDKISVAS